MQSCIFVPARRPTEDVEPWADVTAATIIWESRLAIELTNDYNDHYDHLDLLKWGEI